ncbi:MAG: hypothetical protein NTX59_09105 [Elusimicrobia bacterium]|nr:hypothetical protein [Elusimicrobiota bacterium]
MNPKNENEEFLASLARFLTEEQEADTLTLKDELKEQGINTEALTSRVKHLIDDRLSARLKERRAIAQVESQSFLNRLENVKVEIPKTIQEVKDLLQKFATGEFGGQMKEAAMGAFRNFDKTTEQDLRTILEDLLKLKEIQESDRNNNK